MAEQLRLPSIRLDHIILLLPHRDLLDPPAWITSNFTLSPGGRHVDGKTENKLIVFQDGTYIELIAFVDDNPASKHGHWWGEKRCGIIDWALTSPDVHDVSRLAVQLDQWRSGQQDGPLAELSYTQPRRGGRRKPDGQEIAWFVTFPEGAQRGLAPFWCHDVTPRELRVSPGPQGLHHPCGAVGVSAVSVYTSASARLHGAYDVILARPGNATADAASTHASEWFIEAPLPADARPTPKISLQPGAGGQQANGVDVEIRIEIAVGGPQTKGSIDEKVGLRGEGKVEISFLRTELSGL